jgi:multiple sugar transport system substrate-binding protein
MIPAVVAALAWGGLSSCTRPEEEANTIVFSYWGSPEQQRTERAVIEAFEAANPGVRVKSLPVSPPLQRYNDKVQAMLVGQVAPDVIMIEFSRYDEWRARGVLEDVTGQMAELSQHDELMPVARRAFERDGKFFAVPTNAHAYVTYFNRDALAAAGVAMPEAMTWAWLEEVAPKLSRRAGSTTATSDYAFQLPLPSIMLWAFGASLFDDLFNPTRSTVNTPEAVEAIACIRRLLATGAVLPPEIGTMTLDVGTYQLFRDAKLAFFFSGRWSTPDLVSVTSFSWDVRPMPSGPAGNMSQHGGTLLGVWSGSKNKELAKRFVQFYASSEGMKIVLQGKRLVPVFRKMAYGDEFLALTPPQSLRIFSESMEAGAASNYIYAPGYSEVKRIFEGAMERAMIRPDIPAETILASLEKELNRWIEKRSR